MLGDTHTGESALRKSKVVLMARADSGEFWRKGGGEVTIKKGLVRFSGVLTGG